MSQDQTDVFRPQRRINTTRDAIEKKIAIIIEINKRRDKGEHYVDFLHEYTNTEGKPMEKKLYEKWKKLLLVYANDGVFTRFGIPIDPFIFKYHQTQPDALIQAHGQVAGVIEVKPASTQPAPSTAASEPSAPALPQAPAAAQETLAMLPTKTAPVEKVAASAQATMAKSNGGDNEAASKERRKSKPHMRISVPVSMDNYDFIQMIADEESTSISAICARYVNRGAKEERIEHAKKHGEMVPQ